MLKQFSDRELLGRPLTDEQKKELLALMDRPDEEIDTTDIPEVRELPPDAARGRFPKERAVRLTKELHQFFSAVAARKGVSLSHLVNDILAKELAILETIK